MSTVQIPKQTVALLLQKLKFGSTTRSSSLNCIPGKSVTKLELALIDKLDSNFSSSFLEALLSQEKFSYTYSIQHPESTFKEDLSEVKSSGLFEEGSEKKLLDELTGIYNRVKKNLQKIQFSVQDEYAEHGTNSFGIGYPVVGIQDQNKPDKFIFAPVFIWDLEIEKVYGKKDTYKFSRDADYFVGVNEVLLGYIEQHLGVRFTQIDDNILEDNLVDKHELEVTVNSLLDKLQVKENGRKHASLVKLPSNPKKQVSHQPKIFDSAVFGIYKKPKQSIIRDMETILENYNEFFDIDKYQLSEESFNHLYSSLPTDPSQQSAISSVSDSGGLIIQGPPGTGKSQTLTSLITNSLDNKKRILLVCEKKTAFDVIYQNLEKIGLEKYAVIIEDVNKDRKKVVDFVRDRIDNGRSMIEDRSDINYKWLIDTVDSLSHKVNKYHDTIDQTLLDGMTFSDIIGVILQLTHDDIEIRSISAQIETLDIERDFIDEEYFLIINNIVKAQEKYDVDILNNFGHINESALLDKPYMKAKREIIEFLGESNISVEKFLEDWKSLKKSFKDLVENYTSYTTELKYSIGAFGPVNFKNINDRLRGLIKIVEDLNIIMGGTPYEGLTSLESGLEQLKQLISIDILEKYGNSQQRILSTTQNIKNKCNEMLNLSPYYFDKYSLDVFFYIKRSLYANIGIFSQLHDEVDELLIQLKEEINSLREFMPIETRDIIVDDDFDNGHKILGLIEVVNERLNQFNQGALNNLQENSKKTDDLLKQMRSLKQGLNLFSESFTNFRETYISKSICTLPINNEQALYQFQDYAKLILDHTGNELRKYADWVSFYMQLDEKSKGIIIHLIEHQDKIEKREDWFRVGYYEALLESYEDQSLDEDMDANINRFRERLNEIKVKQKTNIYQIRGDIQYEAMSMFEARQSFSVQQLYNKRGRKGSRRNSLRKIIATDFSLFSAFFPVLMINPQVASSLLPHQKGLFDVVIFDEASQLRLEDTLPCIMRAKKIVISGDSQQMPPSNYFASNGYIEDEIDEDDLEGSIAVDSANVESLLRFGEEQKLTVNHLNNHYRSKHPDLIQFSNQAFYHGRLKPMPPRKEYVPIEIEDVNGVYVPKGIGSNGNVNYDEAKRVVSFLKELSTDNDIPSVLVATLNIYQRDLIKSHLEKEKNDDETSWVSRLEEKGLLVRNLENIQGDEKDVLVISTTFGLKQDGSFSQNFGTLNKQDGYKFLNVLVTRAKKKIQIFTSIPSEYYMRFRDEVALKGNIGKGIFYAYLVYAKAVSTGNEELKHDVLSTVSESRYSEHLNNAESPFEEEVINELSKLLPKNRIIVQHKCGGFRIDIVIKDKQTLEPKYAIECDGASYHSSETACWEDAHRQTILESHGFSFYRIWSTNRWYDRSHELQQLHEFLLNENQV